jgi:hypothetical protein
MAPEDMSEKQIFAWQAVGLPRTWCNCLSMFLSAPLNHRVYPPVDMIDCFPPEQSSGLRQFWHTAVEVGDPSRGSRDL